jgi:hypothetical protein
MITDIAIGSIAKLSCKHADEVEKNDISVSRRIKLCFSERANKQSITAQFVFSNVRSFR